MTLTNAERETHFNMVAEDRTTWYVFTDDPVWIRKMDKCPGATLIRETGEGKEYTLPANWLGVRPPRKGRPLNPEHLKKLQAAAALSRGVAE